MAAKKVDCGSSSFLTASIVGKEPENQYQNVANTFLNDGSFLEQYKRRMEEEESAKNQAKSSASTGKDEKKTDKNTDSTKTNQDNSRKPIAQGNLLLKGKRQLMTGRMGGASKQFHAKKKKQEKEAAQEKEKGDEKNTAWKAYMEEVKKYREASCTEEVDRVRPLVK